MAQAPYKGAIMRAPGKVVALITRLGLSGPEVCVFEHPRAGVQLPAGTLHPDEDPIEGALREAFEETGLDDVEITGQLAAIPASEPGPAVGDTPTRHIVHMSLLGTAPDEWWVLTPDGNGLCWRCFWLPLHDVGALHPGQQPWLRAVQAELNGVRHPPARRRAVQDPDAVTDLTIEFFFAPPLPGEHIQISWLDPEHGGQEQDVGRSEVLGFTDDGLLVVVAEGDPDFLGLPGGHREAGESLEETLRRELREEACAELLEFELIGYQRFRHLEGDAVRLVTTDAMYWARVRCDDFDPRFETRTRRLLTIDEARRLPSWSHPLCERQLDRAVTAERRAAARRPPKI
jgi:8-oxo-dGTP pyrophosphatase MutT (NUDIX family)